MITKDKKKEVFEKTSSIFNDSASAVFVKFSGLLGNEAKEMRASMTSEDVGYKVIKKTLIKKVAEKSKIEGNLPVLDGEISIAYGQDLTLPASKVREFSQKLGSKIEIVGGIFDGVYKNKEEMTEIANIPSLPQLRGMFVNIINSPIQRLAISLNQIAEKKES